MDPKTTATEPRFMTFFPKHPKMEKAPPKDGREMRRLTEDYVVFAPFCLGWSLEIVVRKGFAFDGASIPDDLFFKYKDKIQKVVEKLYPGEDVETVYRRLVGTPWDFPRLHAALPHDGLYGAHLKCRWVADRAYKNILKSAGYDPKRREIEYDCIRLFGAEHWDAVESEEKKATRKMVSAHWIRTKNVPSRIAQLLKKEKKN